MSNWRRLALAFALAIAANSASAQSWSFGLIGDVPYDAYERAQLPHMLAAMAAQKLSLIAHIGDIKSGKEPCSDALFLDRKTLFDQQPLPFIFVPGDNEWSDCERVSNGSYAPLERLQALRRLFFAEAYSLGQGRIAVERQPGEYLEHSRFRLGPVLFVTLNVPGGRNNFGMRAEGSAEFHARNPQVLAWLQENFALARREQLAGMVILMQANPHFEQQARGLSQHGYRALLELLRDESAAFAGQVLVVHGDTHRARVDQPLRNRQRQKLANFTRLETYGYPQMGWTEVRIDPATPELFRFTMHPWSPKRPRAGTKPRSGDQ